MLFDRHGFGSESATLNLLKKVYEIRPDVIHIHNAHGYYLNIERLFNFIKSSQIPTVWTLHDSWAYTGHCTFYESVACAKWQTECNHCPKKTYYPGSYFLDQSNRNFRDKKRLFSDLNNLNLVSPSKWLANEVRKSFLQNLPLLVIHNGIDTLSFRPRENIPNILHTVRKKIILGVASTWDKRKGLEDFKKLSVMLSDEYQIVLVGLNASQMRNLPSTILGISRTENTDELARFYSAADIFLNPTWQDNFPTTNLEALACGTPVITYNTGGGVESINENTGRIVEKGDLDGVVSAALELSSVPRSQLKKVCRDRAVAMFNKEDRYTDYLDVYAKIIRG